MRISIEEVREACQSSRTLRRLFDFKLKPAMHPNANLTLLQQAQDAITFEGGELFDHLWKVFQDRIARIRREEELRAFRRGEERDWQFLDIEHIEMTEEGLAVANAEAAAAADAKALVQVAA